MKLLCILLKPFQVGAMIAMQTRKLFACTISHLLLSFLLCIKFWRVSFASLKVRFKVQFCKLNRAKYSRSKRKQHLHAQNIQVKIDVLPFYLAQNFMHLVPPKFQLMKILVTRHFFSARTDQKLNFVTIVHVVMKAMFLYETLSHQG